MKVRYYAIIGFLILVLLVNVLGVLPYIQWSSFRKADERVTADYIVIGELHHILNTMQDMETGQRGYILTRDPDFLEPLLHLYDLHVAQLAFADDGRIVSAPFLDQDTAPTHIASEIRNIEQKLAHDPDSAALVSALRDRVEQKRLATLDTLRQVRDRGFDDAAQKVKSGKGKTAMDDIRTVIGKLIKIREESARTMLHETDLRMASYSRFVIAGNIVLGVLLLLSFWGLAASRERAIRDRRRIERTDEQLRAFIRHAPAAIGALDRDLRFVIASDRWSSEFDSHWYHTATGMELKDVLPYLQTRDDWQQAVDRCLGGETVIVTEDKITHPDHPDIWARWELHPWGGGKGDQSNGIIISVENITKRKDMERMKDEFVSTVSHELRTPLTSIRGSLGLVAGGVAGPLPQKAQELVDIAYKNSDRLILLINDILDMNKLEADQLELNIAPHDVGMVLQEMVQANQGYADKYGVQLGLGPMVQATSVLVDQHRFQQVLSNLVSNAIKFSPRGATVEAGYVIDDTRVRLYVRDHGPGIPRQFQSRIFEKFAQADSSDARAQGGTGLGLSIAKGLCERMGGWMSFETEEGRGTTFFIELPIYNAAENVSDDDPLVDQLKKSVLHVEDDPDFYRVIRSGLEPTVVVRNARTLRDADVMIDRRDFDLIILDLRLPDGSGLSLLEHIKHKDKCPIVVISAYDIPDDIKPLAAACLVKARTPESEMIEIIMTLLGETDKTVTGWKK
ncbi:ATP-binding protein [Micavibrio aeruginosavorus]|uniref:ATP-binding protein n=1 Tax=Micavibrio aeruginosavorus TaxID=349221 RepID=UPI003F4ADA15